MIARDVRRHLASHHDLRRRTQVDDPPVRARTDYHLVDLHVAHLVDGLGVFRQVREGNRGFNFGLRSMSITLIDRVRVGRIF